MRGVNKVILVGNLGNDPEVKYTQGGMAITSISLATTSVRKDKDGNQQERTEWHRVKFFGKLGEIAGEYLKKGSQVYVEGSIRYDKFTGQDGVEKYFTDIIADEMQMIGARAGGGGGDGDRSGERQGAQQGSRGNNSQGQGQRGGGSGAQGGGNRSSGGQQRREPELEGAGAGGSRGGGGGGFGNFGGGNEPFPDDDIPFATCYSMY